jgi:hypothetical protein
MAVHGRVSPGAPRLAETVNERIAGDEMAMGSGGDESEAGLRSRWRPHPRGREILAVVALLAVPLIGPSSVGGVPGSAGRTPAPVAPLDPQTSVEPQPGPQARRYGAPGDIPVAPAPGPGLLDRAEDADALATVVDAGVPEGRLGIPGLVLAAYENAAAHLAEARPSCGLDWSLLAAIGRIESGHARGGRVDATGRTLEPIMGIALDGRPGIAAIRDTDGGTLDGDARWDRAVGPMQFIPSTWTAHAADGNGDGRRDPHNVFDSAVAAGRLLCAGGTDLRDPRQRAQAVFRYNRSDSYVATVLQWADAYSRRADPVPVSPGRLPLPPGVPDAGLDVPPAVLPAPAPAVPAAVVAGDRSLVGPAPAQAPTVLAPPATVGRPTTTVSDPTTTTTTSASTTTTATATTTTVPTTTTTAATTTTTTRCTGPTTTTTVPTTTTTTLSTTTTTTLPTTTTTTTVPPGDPDVTVVPSSSTLPATTTTIGAPRC